MTPARKKLFIAILVAALVAGASAAGVPQDVATSVVNALVSLL